MSIKLTALRTLTGTYGTVHEGDSFVISEEADAISLESRGLAERYREPGLKMRFPIENKAFTDSKPAARRFGNK